MTPRAGFLFAGIGGFEVGFERAGYEVVFQVEIDRDCQRVLERHWPNVRRYADVKKVHGRGSHEGGERCPGCLPDVDVLCGGFPCQDLSVAGRRAGLAGKRSGLWFEFHRLAAQLRPGWVVIENVPGLLSSNGGRDFEVVVSGLVDLGYGVAWRVLDAQYFGVAQRRRRLFVVGCLGDPARAAQVLLEPESCSGHPTPSREARARVAGTIAGGPTGPRGPGHGARSGQAKDDNLVHALTHHHGRNDPSEESFVVGALTGNKDRGGWRAGPDEAAAGHVVAMALQERGRADGRILDIQDEVAYSLLSPGEGGRAHERLIAHSLRAEGADASEDGTGRGTSLVPTCKHGSMACPECDGVVDVEDEPTPAAWRGRGLEMGEPGLANALRSAGEGHVGDQMGYIAHRMTVRRLTPRECERLQAFADDWTAEDAEGRPISDSARYRMLGNAVASAVAFWVGVRLRAVHEGRDPNSERLDLAGYTAGLNGVTP